MNGAKLFNRFYQEMLQDSFLPSYDIIEYSKLTDLVGLQTHVEWFILKI